MSLRFIDENLIRSFEEAKRVFGTNAKLAEHVGISAKHVGQILARKVQFIKPKTWVNISSRLKPYIEKCEHKVQDCKCVACLTENLEAYERMHRQNGKLIKRRRAEIKEMVEFQKELAEKIKELKAELKTVRAAK